MENYTIVNGKYIPNVIKNQVPVIKKPAKDNFYTPTNWTGITSCGKTEEEMYKYLFPY